MADPRLHFYLVLPALPEEVIEQIPGILHAIDNIADPYRTLKIRLLDLFTPQLLDQCQKIIHGGELGDRRPSQLMESTLALLPPGEPDGMLFKTHFINRLHLDIRDHVVSISAPVRWRQWRTTFGLPETAAREARSITRWRRLSRRMWRSSRRQWPRSTRSLSCPSLYNPAEEYYSLNN